MSVEHIAAVSSIEVAIQVGHHGPDVGTAAVSMESKRAGAGAAEHRQTKLSRFSCGPRQAARDAGDALGIQAEALATLFIDVNHARLPAIVDTRPEGRDGETRLGSRVATVPERQSPLLILIPHSSASAGEGCAGNCSRIVEH